MFIRLVIDFGELVKVALQGSGWLGEELRWLLVFVALVCVWVYFSCCSGVCLYHGLQEAGAM
jgi:hypothetical protein